MVYIKSLDLDQIEQLGIQMFFILSNLDFHLTKFDKNPSWIFKSCGLDWLKFIQMEKWTKYQMYIMMSSNNFVLNFFSFEVIKWVIWPSFTKVKTLVFRNTHFDRTLDGFNWKSHEYKVCYTHQVFLCSNGQPFILKSLN